MIAGESCEHVTVATSHVAEVIEAEGRGVPATVPPRMADILLVVAFAIGGIVGCLATVGSERLRISVQSEDTVDVIAR